MIILVLFSQRILLDLLRKNVAPDAIVEMLRSMCIPAYQLLHQPNISQQTALTDSTSLTAPKASLPSSSSGAVRADHCNTSNSAHTRSLQERSVSARQDNRRSKSDLHRASQSLGSRKTYSQK
ncbi:hypothetical protein RRG08_006324 [Elysia crispata]|uniref:Uncharacterized protein n=1 Tax=Elysia crispata TaxID=231223 RepID=A0AAE1D350_9GAST|nr:hypothetical protein RRG08_006324 [Elysia crispata]